MHSRTLSLMATQFRELERELDRLSRCRGIQLDPPPMVSLTADELNAQTLHAVDAIVTYWQTIKG